MAQKSSRGLITLVRLSDGLNVMFAIEPSGSSTQQIYDGTNYAPNYIENPVTLTPRLTVGGEVITINSSKCTWYDSSETDNNKITVSDGYSINASTGALTISLNLESKWKMYICVVKYTDPVSGNTCTVRGTMPLSRISGGKDSINVLLTPSNAAGNGTGLNYIDDDNTIVYLKAVAYSGITVKTNSSNNADSNEKITYNWTIYDSSTNKFGKFTSASCNTGKTINSTSKAVEDTSKIRYAVNSEYDYSSTDPTSSTYYRFIKLVDSASKTYTDSDADIIVNGDMITIKKDAIDVKESICCTATVYATSSGVMTSEVGSDSDVEVITDYTDDLLVVIAYNTDKFTSGVDTITLTPSIYRKNNNDDVTAQVSPSWDWDGYDIDEGGDAIIWNEYSKDSDGKFSLIKNYDTYVVSEIDETTYNNSTRYQDILNDHIDVTTGTYRESEFKKTELGAEEFSQIEDNYTELGECIAVIKNPATEGSDITYYMIEYVPSSKEIGNGYWLINPTASGNKFTATTYLYTGNRAVTIYKEQVTEQATLVCTATFSN